VERIANLWLIIGLITPQSASSSTWWPAVARMSMDSVTKGMVPFMIAQFLVMFLMVLFPWLVNVPVRLLHGGQPEVPPIASDVAPAQARAIPRHGRPRGAFSSSSFRSH
jgi:hypothetical protein